MCPTLQAHVAACHRGASHTRRSHRWLFLFTTGGLGGGGGGVRFNDS